jgi:hypothetical protein
LAVTVLLSIYGLQHEQKQQQQVGKHNAERK